MTANTALLLIDVQEDFLDRPGLTPDRATLVATLTAVLDHARQSGLPVIHVHTRVDGDLTNAMPHRHTSATAEVVAGTPGAESPPGLAPAAGEPLLFKRFFSAFDAADLIATLRGFDAQRLIVAGVHGHACIRDTVTDAYRSGFEIVIPEGTVASYDPAHASLAMEWMDGRAARVAPLSEFVGRYSIPDWVQLDPRDQRRELQRVPLTPAAQVHDVAAALASAQPSLAAMPFDDRRRRLADWLERMRRSRGALRDAIVRDVAKPVPDAEGEIAYGLALLDDVVKRLSDEEEEGGRAVLYRPRGVIGLITPWNNPFAIALGKIAPALGYGNAVLWKPALPASRISALLGGSLAESGLGEWLCLVTGDSGTGEAIVSDPHVAAISLTGSVPVGRRLIARSGVRRDPGAVQAELGGSNAVIVDESADLDAAAADLARAIFSFSGQRCTAVRRVLLVGEIAEAFVNRLVAAVESLNIGLPDDPGCDIGPLIDRASQTRLLRGVEAAVRDGGRLLRGGKRPPAMQEHGCWMEPTLIEGLAPNHPLNREEWFGPVASVNRVPDFGHALDWHNDSDFGLLGALYSTDEAHIAQFVSGAEAGILSIGRARPPFAASGPFNGWKASGHGIAEHGRWNRDFYTRPQAVYRA